MSDLIERQAAIDELNVGAEFLRRVLDETDLVGAEREKFGWGLGLIESCISDMKDLPSTQPENTRCKDCKHRDKYGCCKYWKGLAMGDVPIATDDNDFCSYAKRI